MEVLETTTTNLYQDSESPGRDFNPIFPEYEAGMLITRPRRSSTRNILINCIIFDFISICFLFIFMSESTGRSELRHNEEHNFHSSPNTTTVTKSSNMRGRAGSSHGDMTNSMYKILVWNPKRNSAWKTEVYMERYYYN
jgi:hypothetical protein